jgi:hypothetical protein
MRSFRMMRRVALAVWAFGALFAYPATPAHAGLIPTPIPTISLPSLPLPSQLPVPVPSLPIVNDLLPSPTVTGVPPVPLPGQLNDTVNGVTNDVTGLLGLSGSNGPNQPGTHGSGTGSTSTGTGGTSHGSTKTTTGKTSLSHNTSTGANGQTVLDGIGVIQPGEAFAGTYGAMAGRAAQKAAGRALTLAGPLAPPLLLSVIALGVLMMMSRGSTKLVKLDVAGLARRTWRI